MIPPSNPGPPRRAVLGGLAGIVTLAGLSGCGSSSAAGLDGALADLVTGLDPAGPYRHPTSDERRQARTATDQLITGDTGPATAALYAALGITVTTVTDTATGRRFAVAAGEHHTERAWGLLIIDLTVTAHLLIEIPHPVADQNTEHLGLTLLRAVPGAALIVAGAHRRAAEGRADVAHQPNSLFHVLTELMADRGLAQLQLHGFQDDSLPGMNIVISAGAGQPDPRTEHAADRLADAGFDVCRAWRRNCGSLEGRRNAQGRAAADHGQPFTHLEINRSTRTDPAQHVKLIDALVSSFHRGWLIL